MRLLHARFAVDWDRLYNRVCLLAFTFVVAAASFHGFYAKWHFLEVRPETADLTGGFQHATFEQLMDGTAWRPYVYRQMIPIVANAIDRRVPEDFKDKLFTQSSLYAAVAKNMLNSPITQDRRYFFRFLVTYCVVFLFAWAALIAMFCLCRTLPMSRTASALTAATFLLLMPFLSTICGYMYDYPELFFLTLAVWIALKRQWWFMIPVAALATLNKESFLLFIPAFYPLFRQRTSRFSAGVGTAVVALSSGIVYELLRLRFKANPGATVEWHFWDQARFLVRPMWWINHAETTYGWLLPPTWNPLFLVIVVWTVWRGWRFLPAHIRRFATIAAAINLPLFLLFCAGGELRDLSMLYIPFLLLIGVNIANWEEGRVPVTAPSARESDLTSHRRPERVSFGRE
jgi:hypothetical protein